MLHFPADEEARKVVSQFMLGENILVSPVFGEKEYIDVYLPGETEWTHLWSGTTYKVNSNGLKLRSFLVMYGQPAVFYRDTASFKISSVLEPYRTTTKIDLKL